MANHPVKNEASAQDNRGEAHQERGGPLGPLWLPRFYDGGESEKPNRHQ